MSRYHSHREQSHHVMRRMRQAPLPEIAPPVEPRRSRPRPPRRWPLALLVVGVFVVSWLVAFIWAAGAMPVGSERIQGTRVTPEYPGGNAFAWSYSYSWGFDGGALTAGVRLGFLFDPVIPAPIQSAYFPTIERQIEGMWSNRYVAVDTATGDRWPIRIDVMHGGGGPADQTVRVTAGDRGDMLTWMTDWRANQVPHEFGHMLGLFDEYHGGAMDTANPIVSYTGLMGWGALRTHPEMFPRYYEGLLEPLPRLNGGGAFALAPGLPDAAPVMTPEPGTLALLGTSALALGAGWLRRRRHR